MYLDYLQTIQAQLDRLKTEGAELFIEAAARHIADAIQQGGIIHIFGSGHSHVLSEELFYRAGGLAAVNPILVEPLMLHEGALRSTTFERTSGYIQPLLEAQSIEPGDVMIVNSTSGKNPVPIEAALYAREKGVYVIGLTSFDYSAHGASRHSSGQHLLDVVDLPINNYAVRGDAVLTHENVAVPFGPTSTVMGVTILNAIFVEATALLIQSDIEPPIFLSANVPGAEAHNHQLVERYKKRIPLLK